MFFFDPYILRTNFDRFTFWRLGAFWEHRGAAGWSLTLLSTQDKWIKHIQWFLMFPRPYMALSIQVLCRQVSTSGPYPFKIWSSKSAKIMKNPDFLTKNEIYPNRSPVIQDHSDHDCVRLRKRSLRPPPTSWWTSCDQRRRRGYLVWDVSGE